MPKRIVSHTEAPWWRDGRDIDAYGHNSIAILNDENPDWLANGGLIIAAPDTFAVCEKLVAWLERADAASFDAQMGMITVLYQEAQRAIAKATGVSE